MQQPYSNYPPYYGQPMYPHTPYMGQAGPPGPSSAYPPSMVLSSLHLLHPQEISPPLPRILSMPPRMLLSQAAPSAPLKSAMKKTMNVFNAAENTLGRQFSNPFSHAQQNPAPPFPRPRVQSNPQRSQNAVKEPSHEQTQPTLHMLLSFHGLSELHIEYIMQMGLEEMRKVIWPLWRDGVESDTITGHTCIVKFRNTPWDLNGPNVRNLVPIGSSSRSLLFFKNGFVPLYSVKLREASLHALGYSFQTAVNISSTSPRLVFQVTQPAPSEFFLSFFSQDGRKLTLINPPNRVDLSIGAHLRSALPNSNVIDNVIEEETRVIEVKPKFINSPEVESSTMFIEVLKILNNLGYQLDATVPLSRKGTLGLRNTRELLVFKEIATPT
ncbi:hypothetical protein CPB84DRAFT_1893187 [Gymnopilus junonius]|uniref:Uncharacterized protein n=1 Tax=Gymnopilus junonius TaxID=109634 RepID=A0A9P5NUB6_GYMJU|nr:hypothetical protein CPB84DRAFT_1893187 [Gymnopilus junonius]